jgi:RNA 2',3'-cyclic 3'-phosphodiesterase
VEGLHLTLKFIGEVKDEKLNQIKHVLGTIKAATLDVSFAGTGFFPTPRSPRVFWAGVHAGQELPALAAAIDSGLGEAKLGIEREKRAYSPHLTLARAGAADPGSLKGLAPLVEREATPQFGTMTAREFWIYRSELGRGGSKYTKLERFALEGK